MIKPLALFLCFGLWACDDDSSARGFEIADEPLTGLMNDSEWTVNSARSTYMGDDLVTAELFAEAVGCDDLTSADKLIINVPIAKGDYLLDETYNGAFVFKNYYNQTTTKTSSTGRVKIRGVANGLLKGGIYLRFDEENEVSGAFEIELCGQ